MSMLRQPTWPRSDGTIDVYGRASFGVAASLLMSGVLLALFLTGCDSASTRKDGTFRTFYKGHKEDIKAMRETRSVDVSGKARTVSTGSAMEAARRVFDNIGFVGMTRESVLTLLGDPATISYYGVPAEPGPDGPLVYAFRNGWVGPTWVLRFRAEKVIAIETRPSE